jgi:hypothetical protein
VLVILGLGGALAAWLLIPKGAPESRFLPLVVDQYDDPRIPVSPWADQDRTALRLWGWQGAKAQPNTFTSQQRDLFLKELDGLSDKGWDGATLVLYLRGHAVTAEDGGVAFLPGDVPLDDDSRAVALVEVMLGIRKCPAAHKLLLLDVMQPFVNLRAGVLDDDPAARAAAVLRDAAQTDPNLLILCACSPGQNSLASEELGHTAFAYFVLQGLDGQADGWNDAKDLDTRVSARELAAYVAAQVGQWAPHTRGRSQTPLLIAGKPDLDFLLVVSEPGHKNDPAPLDATYPDWLRKGWELRDGWLADGRVRTPPEMVRRLQDNLLRAEARWRAGGKAEDVQAEFQGQRRALESRREGLPAAPPTPRSLAEAVARGAKTPAVTKDTKQPLERLTELGRAASKKPPDTDAAQAPAAKAQLDAKRKEFLDLFKDKPFDLAWTVFRVARVEDVLTPEDAREWTGLLRPEAGDLPDYAEIQALARLADLEVKAPADWPNQAVACYLELAEKAAQADADLDQAGRAAPRWLADGLGDWRDRAYGRRAKAEGLLLGPPAGRAQALPALKDALSGDNGYDSLEEALTKLRPALRDRDTALAFLPGFTPYLEREPGLADDWEKAVGRVRDLGDLLDRPPAGGLAPEWFDRLKGAGLDLRRALDRLRRPVAPAAVQALIDKSPKAAGADAEEMNALLRTDALPAADRVRLWAAWREASGRLTAEALTRAAQLRPGEAPTEPPPPAAASARDRALLRARAAVGLLRLDGRDATKAEDSRLRAAQAPDDAQAWRALGRALRDAWKGQDGDRPGADASR